uniref:Uncharacterized protein n=1 Tax=Timema poppense TaxID=170557 RepID=A0A7R9HBD3_TIMPO|nr:unnamed protein product [Timema poppensis]
MRGHKDAHMIKDRVIDLSLPKETNESTTLFQHDTLKHQRIKMERFPPFCEDETMAIADVVYIWEELSPSDCRPRKSMQGNSTEREYQQLTLMYGGRPPDNGNTWDIREVGFNGVTSAQESWNQAQKKKWICKFEDVSRYVSYP